jgi:hypothetical protein
MYDIMVFLGSAKEALQGSCQSGGIGAQRGDQW